MTDEKPTAIVPAAPGSRLDALAAEYAAAKPAADAAAARLKEITDAIKVELTTAAPGSERVLLQSGQLERPLRLLAKTSWRLNTEAFKRDHPGIYVRYAKQSTAWELKQA